jgi:hypothetical protein
MALGRHELERRCGGRAHRDARARDRQHGLGLPRPVGGAAARDAAGRADIGVSTDLWIGSLAVANVQRSGTGCSGATAPTLSAFGVPVLGDAQFRFDVNTAPANGIVVSGSAPVPACCRSAAAARSTCKARSRPAAALANAAGFTSLAFPIPAIPALVGFGMTAQAAALDAAAPLGLTLTSQLSVRVGI